MNLGELTASLRLNIQEFSQNIQAVQRQLQTASEKIKTIGVTMSAAVTAPLVAAGAVLAKSAMDIQASTGEIQASLGVTAEEAKKLSASAQDVWKTGFVDSIDEANQAIILIRQNMAGVAENEMAQVAQGAAMIAERMGEDVSAVTATAGVMMKNYGIAGQEALDLIAVGFQKGGNFSQDLLDTMQEYAPKFKEWGMSADQALGMLLAGAEKGAFNLDKVGDSAKESFISITDGSKSSQEAIASLGLSYDDIRSKLLVGGEEANKSFGMVLTALSQIEDPVKRNDAALAIFKTQVEDLGQGVVLAMADGAKGLGDFKGATDKATAAITANNPGLALTQALREMQVAIAPALTPLVDIIQNSVVPAIKSMSEWFQSLSPEGQKLTIAIAGIAAAMGPMLVIIGSLAGALSGLIGFFTAGAAGVSTFGVVMAALTGPIGIAIAAVTALIAAGTALYLNWDTISSKASKIWNSIKNTIHNLWKAAVDVFYKYHPIGIVINHWTEIKKYLANVATDAVNWGKNIIDGIINGIKSKIAAVGQTAENMAESIKSKFKSALGIASPSKVMEDYGQNITQGLVIGIESEISEAEKAARKLADATTNAIKSALSTTKAAFEIGGISLIGADSQTKLTEELKGLNNQFAIQKTLVSKLKEEYDRLIGSQGMAAEDTASVAQQYASEAKALSELAMKISDAQLALEQQRWVTAEVKEAIEILRAEHEKETAMLDVEAGKVEELTLRQRQLNQDLSAQRELVSQLTREYEASAAAKGTDSEETRKAYKELLNAQTEEAKLMREIRTTNKAISDQSNTLRELADQAQATADKYKNELTKAEDEYKEKVLNTNQELEKSIDSLTQKYEQAVDQRSKSLMNFVGLFDAVKPKEVTGIDLLGNLQGQVDTFEQWQANIQELATRGINEGLLGELEDMGPSAASEIAALLTLTDDQLQQYSDLWLEKSQLAKYQATSELQELNQETQAEISNMRIQAAQQLEQYRKDWEKKSSEIRANAVKEINTIENKFSDVAGNSTRYGIQVVQGFMRGLESQFDALRERVSEMAGIVSSGITIPLEIASPSKLMDKYGNYIVEGLVGGIKSNLTKVKNAVTKMTDIITIKPQTNQEVKTVFSSIEQPKLPDVTQQVGTVWEKISQPILPELTQKVKTAFETIQITKLTEEPSEIPELIQQIKTAQGDIEQPEIPGVVQDISYDIEQLEFPTETQKVKTIFESTEQKLPDILQKIKTVFDEIKFPELMQQIKVVWGKVTKPVLPDLVQKVKTSFEEIKAPKLSEILQNIGIVWGDAERPTFPNETQSIDMVYREAEPLETQELTQEINTEQGNIDQPLLKELMQNIRVIWDKITQPVLPDLFQQIKTTINEIKLPELPEMELMIKPIIKSLPKLEDVSLSMASITSPGFVTPEAIGGTNNYGGSIGDIYITGSNAEEIWEKLERKLGRLGMVF